MNQKDKTSEEKNENPLSWVLVNSLGKLRFSKSSFYYIVIVPILVKALEKVNSPFPLKVGDSIIQINLELPFSWYLFYFGALAIAIGSILYEVFCPGIIKSYKNYGEFLSSGESDSYLDRVSKKYNLSTFVLPFMARPYLEQKTIEEVKIQPSRYEFKERTESYEKVVDYKHNIKYQEDRKDEFNKLYNEVKFTNKKIIYASFSLYIVGFTAFIWVIIQNIYFVTKHLLN